jgi:hypothetical protein
MTIVALAVALASTLTGCAPAATPQCSDAIAGVWAPDGSTRLDAFPASDLLAGLGARCFVAVEVDKQSYGEAIVEGVGSEHRIAAALKAHGFTHDETTDSWSDHDQQATIGAERTITAADGVPELTGTTVSVLYVGPISP